MPPGRRRGARRSSRLRPWSTAQRRIPSERKKGLCRFPKATAGPRCCPVLRGPVKTTRAEDRTYPAAKVALCTSDSDSRGFQSSSSFFFPETDHHIKTARVALFQGVDSRLRITLLGNTHSFSKVDYYNFFAISNSISREDLLKE